MNPASVDIKDMLESYGDSSGLDVEFAGTLFIGREPSDPPDCITIYDTPGFSPSLDLDGATGYEYLSIQIRVRNRKYLDGWNLINNIKTILHGRHHEVWGNSSYQIIQCSSGPALLDFDDHNRARFIINFNLQRR